MNEKTKITTRPLSSVKKYEVFSLKRLCFTHGVFKVLLTNFQKQRIKNPEKIYLSLLKKNNVSHAWMLEDCAGEYDQSLGEGECSIMFYTHPQHLRLGYSSQLIQKRLDVLRKYSMLRAYCWPDDEVLKFFHRVADKYQLNISIHHPTFYGENLIEIKTEEPK